MNPISPSGMPMAPAAAWNAAGASPAASPETQFKDYLLRSLAEVNAMQHEADRAVEQLATGGDISPAEVLTAVQKADLAFKMMLQIRNKLIQAYQEVQNIRV